MLAKLTNFLEEKSISDNAQSIIELCRKNKNDRTKLDAFLNEYGLDNKEGVALMCLAESVLRIPDKNIRRINFFILIFDINNWLFINFN